jgi:hypothetical protein
LAIGSGIACGSPETGEASGAFAADSAAGLGNGDFKAENDRPGAVAKAPRDSYRKIAGIASLTSI